MSHHALGSCLVLVAVSLAGAACATGGKGAVASNHLDSLPLFITTSSNGTYLPEIQLLVDGHPMLFLLDTGAASSSVGLDEHTKRYASLGSAESRGASGQATSCDRIQVEQMSMGQREFGKTTIKRCGRNILGLDLLGELVFEVDLAGRQLTILKHLPGDAPAQPIRRLAPGHVTIPLILDQQTVDVLFDTGADTTVIDSRYLDAHPQSFELVRSEEGQDANGNPIPSNVYRCHAVGVASLQLSGVEMAAFEFGEHRGGRWRAHHSSLATTSSSRRGGALI